MANISTADGVCRIIASSEKICNRIFAIIDKMAGWQYGTWFSNEKEMDRISDGRNQLEVIFTGFGRWSYADNISSMFRWLKDYLSEDESEFLTNIPFEIQFEYTDYESGFQFLNDELIRVIHKVGQNPIESEVVEDDCINYPYSPLWLSIKVFGAIDEALDCEFWWDEIDESNKKRLYRITIDDYMRYYNLEVDEARNRVLKDSEYFKEIERIF